MADDAYTLRRKYWREKARETEREYSRQAIEKFKETITRDARAGIDKSKSALQARRQLYKEINRDGFTLDNLGRYAEESLAEFAGNVGTVLSPITGAVDVLVPDLGLVDALMKTDIGQQVKQKAQEYPRTLRNTSNALEVGSVVPGSKFMGKLLNALMDNTPTEMPGFYSGNPVGAFAKATVPAIPSMFGQLFNPRLAAERRVIGTGQGRREEYVTNPKQSVQTGNMLASSHMDKQNTKTPEGGDNVVQSSAEVQRYVQDSFDLSDTPRLKNALSSLEPDTPKVVIDAAANHARVVHKADNRAGGTTAVVRRPLSGEKLSGEATGVATTASSVSRSLASKPSLDAARRALPDAEGIDFYRQYLSIAKHANNDRVRKAVSSDILPKDATASSVQQDYWKGVYNKSQGKKVTENQQKAFEFFEGAPEIKMTDRGDGIYTLQDTTKSAAQDLGGMNQFLAIDVNNHKAWTMGSDGHDMFGVNPPGGNALINVVPIHSFEIGTKKTYPAAGGVDVDLRRIEELTGIPRNKGESATAYQKRVFSDYEGVAKLRDYLEVSKNIVGSGMLTSALSGVESNEER